MPLALVALLALLGSAPAPPSGATIPSWAEAAWPDAPYGSASTVRDSLTTYYIRLDTSAVDRLYRRAARTREDRLLCRYRLYPMTLDPAYIRDIPSEQGVTSARELALISALWAYRASSAPAWNVPTYGRRAERVLNQARAINPNEPYVLLVEGQSLYYRPALFGGDARQARERFERLRTVLRQRPAAGIHPFEAEVWVWMALRKTDRAAAETLRRDLLARRPPPLFRRFLLDPP